MSHIVKAKRTSLEELTKQVNNNKTKKDVTRALFVADNVETLKEPKKAAKKESKKTVKNCDIHVRVTEEERENLEKIAAADGSENVSSFVRRLLKKVGM